MSYEFIQVRTEADKVGVITLNRPKQLNALNPGLMVELGTAIKAYDSDPAIGCMVLTGTKTSLSVGADLGPMSTIYLSAVSPS